MLYNDYRTHMERELDNQRGFCNIFKIGRGEKLVVYNFIPMGFDIETYTQHTVKTIYDKKKNIEVNYVDMHYTNMYVWQFAFGSIVLGGRTWEEFHNLIEILKDLLCHSNYKTFFFIHNCGFEFAFMGKELRKYGHTISVFARKKRHPMRIEIDEKIVILDSVMLTGFSLKKLAENITKKTQKLDGDDFNYTEPRNRFTPLNKKQELYCENDVRILAEYAIYYLENYINIDNPYMPLTSTMIANRELKEKIRSMKCQKNVAYLMMNIYPKSRIQYEYIMQFFSGAYTHGMLCNLFKTIDGDGNGILSYDVTSEYPYMSMAKYFPMTKWRIMRTKSLQNEYLESHCCLCKCIFTNLKQKYGVTVLSKHKAHDYDDSTCTWDNGRLYHAKENITFMLTELDIQTINNFYTYDNLEITEMLVSRRGTLPNYYRLTIADLYYKKSVLKGVKGKEVEYMNAKANLNSLSYGAMCTKLTFEEIEFIDDWTSHNTEIEFDTMWKKKDKSPAWAIYVTAHARHFILDAILQIVKRNKKDYLYSDTDSIKAINKKYVRDIFNAINEKVRADNDAWIDELHLNDIYPDVDWNEIGTFENETKDHVITKFKCLGSKRYLTEIDGKLEATVAGLPKKTFEKYVSEHNIKNPFDLFSDNLFFDETETNKLTAYYEDHEKEFEVTDKYGNTEICHTQSYVSLIPTTFHIGIQQQLMTLFNETVRTNSTFVERRGVKCKN